MEEDTRIDKPEYVLNSRQSLSQLAVRGGVWVFALRIMNTSSIFARTIILARLLAPNDFGLLGIALLAMSTLETFSRTGFDVALIQKKENTSAYLDTSWTVQFVRGILLFSILVIYAPLIALFFHTFEAGLIIRVIAVAELINGFVNIGVIFFQKELQFSKHFVYQFSGKLAELVVCIPVAFILQSVWALVFGLLAGQFSRLIISYIIHPYRPHVAFSIQQFRELISFGKWILGSSIIVFLATESDAVLIGKLLGATALGLYQMAYRISNTPATQISHVVLQVTFPAFSKLQNNVSKLGDAYLKVFQLTVFVSIPLAALIFVLAPQFTEIFLGVKWMPIVPAMRMLVLAGLLRSIAATPIFSSIGRPRIETLWQGVRLAVIAVLIYPLTSRWGILGASTSVFFSNLVSTIGFNLLAIKVTECGIRRFCKILFLSLVNGIALALSVFIALRIFRYRIGICYFFSFSGLGILIYLCIACLFDRLFDCKMQLLIKQCFSSLR